MFHKIYDVIKSLSSDTNLGPVPCNTYGDFIFGCKPISKSIIDLDNESRGTYLGYFSWNIVSTFENKQKNNSYEYPLCDINHDNGFIKYMEELQQKCYIENTIPLFKRLYDLSSENQLNQSEMGRALDIPSTLLAIGKEKDRMIAELIQRADFSGLIGTKKIGSRRIIYPGDICKIPENEYDVKLIFNKQSSKYEAHVKSILLENNYNIKWQYKLPDFKGPYDFAILNDENEPFGVIEVQGEQHLERIKHFHPNESDFEDRKKLDERKKEIAISNGLKYLAITSDEITHKNSKTIITKKLKEIFG